MSELNSSLCQLNWLIAKGGSTVEEKTSETPNNNRGNNNNNNKTKAKSKKSIQQKSWLSGEEKPPFSYSELIKMAIDNTAQKRCTLAGIYSFISENFQFYKENRNASWRNSIRHNLSLNSQFKRLDKMDGDKACYWICVKPPEKKPRILSGAPARINPAIEKMFLRKKKAVVEIIPSVHEQATPSTSQPPQQQHLSEQEIDELNLFESYDLNASFRVVYDQIFEKNQPVDRKKEVAQIDWLKISLEAAGLDYTNEQEMRNVDMDRFKEYMTYSTDSRSISVDSSSSSSLYVAPPKEDSDDEFDWSLIV